jgi:hypothetical protein
MPKIVIKDLTESLDLDRKAMTAIVGGARTRGRQPSPALTATPDNCIVDYPPGVKRNVLGKLHQPK